MTWPEAQSARPLYMQAVRATLLGLAINLSLGIIKLAGGIIGGSFALISDAVNSLGDSLSSFVTLAALWYAQMPADEEHPNRNRRERLGPPWRRPLFIGSPGRVGRRSLGRTAVQLGR